MLKVTARIDGLDQAFNELAEELAQVARGLSVVIWNSVLEKTPQYAGRMAASWTYSLGTPVFVDRSKTMSTGLGDVPPGYVTINRLTGEEEFIGRRKGDPEAIGIANFASEGADAGFKLGMTIWMANGVDHGEGAYSGDVEGGGVRLRSVNRPGAPVKRTLDAVTTRYGKGISSFDAEYLKNLRIGGRNG